MSYIAHEVSVVYTGDVGVRDARVCEHCLSSTSVIVFNTSAGAITNHIQKTDRYLTLATKPVLILLNEQSKPGAHAHDIK